MAFNVDKEAFTKRLRQAVRALDKKYNIIAKDCGISLPSLEYYLYQGGIPNGVALAQICKGLGISADWLLFGEDAT